MAIFSAGEIERRQAAIRGRAADEGCDTILLTSADNVYYATGVPLFSEWGRPMWAVLTPDRTVAIGSKIEEPSMRDHAQHCEIAAYGDERNTTNAALGIAVRLLAGATSLGIEKRAMPLGVFDQLQGTIRVECVADVSAVLAGCRILKSQEELHLLRLGGQVAKFGADAFVNALGGGVKELAVAGAAVRAMGVALGALTSEAASSSYAYCQFGDHSLTPHAHPTGRRLLRGDLVALNVFPVVSDYCVELDRTLVFGEPTPDQQELLDVVGRPFALGKSRYCRGERMSDVDRACTEVLESAGFGRHGTGHAHGIMIGAASREELGELREVQRRHSRTRNGQLDRAGPLRAFGWGLPAFGRHGARRRQRRLPHRVSRRLRPLTR